MAVSLKHTTQATGTDAGNGEIRKAQWNEEHTLTAAADTLLGAVTAGAVGEITCTAAGRALLDDANAAAQRTTLGLGSAATLTAGTAANNLVQLDSSAKLPAVDGSALTNLPTLWGRSLIDTQTFNASGTWTKPSSGVFAVVRCWGGGGSGMRRGGVSNTSGAGGGAYHEYILSMATLPSTVSVTVGAGGIAPTTVGVAGNAGGATSFGSYVSANGGAGTTATGGSGQGGSSANAVSVTVAVSASALSLATSFPPTVSDVGLAGFVSLDVNPNRQAGGNGLTGTGGTPSTITYAGGGGGGGNSTSFTLGQPSTYGGKGGDGSTSGSATSGSQPGGGGGNTYNGPAAGNGGDGRCVVYVF